MRTSRLGQLLVEEGLLSEKDRRTIKRNCGYTGGAFAKSVVSLGLMDEVELASFLAEKTNSEIASKNLSDDAQPSAIGAVDLPLLEKLEVIPLELRADILKVAMVDPLDMDTIAQLEFFTNYKIIPIVATQTQIHDALAELLRGYEPGLTNLEEFLHNHATPASKRLKIIQGATIGDTPVPVKPYKETSAPPQTEGQNSGFKFTPSQSFHEDDEEMEIEEDIEEFSDEGEISFSDDLDLPPPTTEQNDEPDEFDDLVDEEEDRKVVSSSEDSSSKLSNVSAKDTLDIENDLDIESDLDIEGDIDANADQDSNGDLDALDELDDLEDGASTEEVANLANQTLSSEVDATDADSSPSDDDVLKSSLANSADDPSMNNRESNTELRIDEVAAEVTAELGDNLEQTSEEDSSKAALPDLSDLDSALAASSPDTAPSVEDPQTTNDNEPESAMDALVGLDDLEDLKSIDDSPSMGASSTLENDIEINPSAEASPQIDCDSEEIENIELSAADEELDGILAGDSIEGKESDDLTGAGSEFQVDEDSGKDEIPDEAPLIGDDDEGIENLELDSPDPTIDDDEPDFDDPNFDQPNLDDPSLDGSSSQVPLENIKTEQEQMNLRKISMSAVASINKALMKLGMLTDRDEVINEVALALLDSGINKLLLIENSDVLTPLISWEFTEENLVVKEQELESYITEGLNHAFSRLFAGWTTFDDATREENLKPFESWTESGEVIAASMIACGEVKVIAVVAWSEPHCDSQAIRASSLDLVKRLIKKI